MLKEKHILKCRNEIVHQTFLEYIVVFKLLEVVRAVLFIYFT